MNTHINIWSSPRNISTAFMYAWAQRPDCTVVDEPLYAHYLRVSGLPHPGREEVMASQNQDGEQVVQNILLGEYNTPIALFKQMTHHLVELEEAFLLRMKNVLLIRDPRQIIASYAKVITNPTMQDVGIRQQAALYDYLSENGKVAAVIDTNRLLQAPKLTFQRLCAVLDVPFYDEMLHWKAGARPEDGVWAKYWYDNVHRSTGFQPYQAKDTVLLPDLEVLAKKCMPYYEHLSRHAL